MEPKAFVLVLTGPSGSGKSTTARAWADAQPVPTACINLDEVRWFVRAGRARPDKEWGDDAERQWMLAVRLCSQMARTYVEHGMRCVIDVYAPPMTQLDPWTKELVGLDVRSVYLLPPFAVCQARNGERVGEGQLDEEPLARNYEEFAWCVEQKQPEHVIDNAGMSIAEAVQAVERAIATSRTK
jgi:adenylylsulfate kinase-like enzyme